VLPHYHATSPYAEHGTAVHHFIARAHEIGRDRAIDELDVEAPHRPLCEALPFAQLPAGGSHEVALAWDYESDVGRVLSAAGHRDYSDAAPTEYVGTADYVGRDYDMPVVLDYKTGHRFLGPARQSRQLRMLALAASRIVGVDGARVAYCFLHDDGSYAFSWATFDAFDLAEIADELRDLAAVLVDAQTAVDVHDAADFHEGEWCDFCPAYNGCPAKMQLARAIGTGDALRELANPLRRIEQMTDDELARAYEAIERYDDLAARVRKALRDRAAMQPIELSDGRRIGAIPWPCTSVRADVAYATVRELHGDAVAEEACPRKATLAALRRLGGDTLAEVERRRGVVTISKPQVRVHRP
jgi:hypothetical protein